MKRARGVLPWLLACVLLATVGYLLRSWHIEAAIQRPLLAVSFDHLDHRAEPCAYCHHNFTDDTGGGPCYHCHKVTAAIAADIEGTFHDFCRGCHVEARLQGRESGPLRSCAACHP